MNEWRQSRNCTTYLQGRHLEVAVAKVVVPAAQHHLPALHPVVADGESASWVDVLCVCCVLCVDEGGERERREMVDF